MRDDRPFGSSNWTLVVAALLLVPFLLWVTGIIAFDDASTPDRAARPTPTTAPEPTAAPDATPEPTAEPTPAATEPPGSTFERSDPDASIGDDAPPEVAASLARAEAGGVPSLGAVLDDGRIHLIGAVPGRTEADDVIAIAATLVGPDAVVDAMVLDERADAPASFEVRVDDASAWAPEARTVDPALVPLAEAVATVVADGAAAQVTVVGHVEDTGDPLASLDASRRRAQAFAEAIIDAGAARSQVSAIGRGSSRPLADTDDPMRNHRIDLVFEL